MAAAECLALLFQFPLHSIAGLDLPLEGDMKVERDQEWNDSVAALEILYSRPNWLSKMLAIWRRFEQESYTVVERYFFLNNYVSASVRSLRLTVCCRMLQRTVTDWHAAVAPAREEIHTIWDLRGVWPLSPIFCMADCDIYKLTLGYLCFV